MTDSARSELVRRRLDEHLTVTGALRDDEHVRFTVQTAAIVARALQEGNKVLLCGNGGSAADASHLAAELVGRFLIERRPLPAISLSDNSPALTAIANDIGFSEVFARQVRALGCAGDVLFVLSTSGASENVLAAARVAHELGLTTIGLTGRAGIQLAESVDYCLRVPAEDTTRIQEAHMLVGHTLFELVEQDLVERDLIERDLVERP